MYWQGSSPVEATWKELEYKAEVLGAGELTGVLFFDISNFPILFECIVI